MIDFRHEHVILFAVALLSGSALAAGQHDGGHGHQDSASTGDTADRTIRITTDGMSYSPDSIRVESGETIRFVVHNPDRLVHEFNIASPAGHQHHQEEMQAMMEAGVLTPTEYHEPDDHHDGGMMHSHANSVLIEPGETRELVWTFEEARNLEFACNVPGHYQAGMQGEIRWVN